MSDLVEMRRDEDGALDEVVIKDDRGRVIFHMERMDEADWWAAVYPNYPGGDGFHLHWSGRTVVDGEVEE